MNFGNIWFLLHLLWILPLCGITVYYSVSKRNKIMKLIFGDKFNSSSFSTVSKTKRYIRILIFTVAIVFITLALAMPRWDWKILPYSGKGRDLMIVLDVSKSMNAEDVKPSRLKHAKFFLRNLINSCPGDRFGLISFAGSAFLECPLTVDKTSLFQALDEVNTDSIPLGGTNVEKSLATAITAFKAAEGGHRAIILVTDGDELSGDSKKELAKLNEMKIPLFIVGIGDPEGDGIIKTTDSNGNVVLLRDKSGKLVKSRLNEGRLKLLKEKTNGIYVRSVETNSGLKPILKRIKALVPKQFEKGYNKRPMEKFYYPLFVAVILLLVYLSISERIRETNLKVPSSCILIYLLIALFPFSTKAQQVKNYSGQPVLQQINKSPLNLADSIEEDKNKTKVEKELKDAENLKNPIDIYNRALALHKAKKDEIAEVLYKKAINLAGDSPEVRGKAFQNLGVIAHAKARKFLMQDQDKTLDLLKNAETLYREAMRSDVHLKKVVLNQQRLLDDRKLAKQIKKMKQQLQDQQKKAQQKTKEALNQQKKENKKNQQQKKNQSENKKKKDKNQKQEKENQNKNKNKNKNDKQQDKQKSKKENKSQQSEKQKTEQKLKEAQQAVKNLKEQAEKLKNNNVQQQAAQAEEELKKAQKERKKGEGSNAEKHIKKALEKLKQSQQNKNKQKNDKKSKKSQKDNKNSKQQNKAQKDKDNKQNNQNKRDRKLDRPNPKDKQIKENKQSGKDENKDIDPKQAEALLKMMADDEKKLREKLKEIQKRQAAQRKPEKDW